MSVDNDVSLLSIQWRASNRQSRPHVAMWREAPLFEPYLRGEPGSLVILMKKSYLSKGYNAKELAVISRILL